MTELDGAVYRAEHDALDGGVGRFRRFAQVEAWVAEVVGDPRWTDELASRWDVHPPLEVVVVRRSRSATFSAAEADRPVIHLRDGSWDRLTVLHELAHLAARDDSGRRPATSHGPLFCAVELDLVRWFCGYHAYGALRSAFEANAVGVLAQRSGSAAARS